jgi:SAM-dependent methyltransferase
MSNILIERVRSVRVADRLAGRLSSPGVPAALRTTLVRQFHRPAGPLGHVTGWIMANRSSNVERNRWAVEQLDVRPTDRVLEIGFGPGVAVEALAARATEGVVFGVDHSPLMTRAARRRNARAVAAGRVVVRTADVADVADVSDDVGLPPLDIVLAVNNLGMWPDPPAQLRRILPLLRPGGRIAIGTQPRVGGADAETARRAAEQTAALLADAGFDALETRSLALDPPMVLVIGSRPEQGSARRGGGRSPSG